MAGCIKNRHLSETLDDNLEKTKAIAASLEDFANFTEIIVELCDDGDKGDLVELATKVLGYRGDLEGLTGNRIKAFEELGDDLKQDKKFLILALMSGVDGRLLAHVSPYLIFTDQPEKERKFDEWYENASFDDEFFRLVAELNEHSFFGFWSNPKIEEFAANGYEKFDVWENESAWVSAGKNPKFLKYHDDLSLELVMKEWAGSAVERTLQDTIKKVNSDLPSFARSILPDYFNMMDLTQIEKQFNIEFGDSYLELVGKSDEQMPALNNHDKSVEIYDLTNLSDFEATIKFIISFKNKSD